VIKSFRHKGIQRYFETGSKAGIQAKHAAKLNAQLTLLNAANGPDAMKVPAWRLHSLHGELEEHWEVKVDGNWRLTFRFEGEDAILVDYQDYH
jgi:proteic killer suppression protein